jgi:hypothetical protein
MAWLFPATFAAHLLEELLAAEWFGAWSSRALGLPIGHREFVAWNAVALALMCAGAALTARPALRWIEIAMAFAVIGNAGFHLIASAATLTYSPGLVTAAGLWIPLGVHRLKATWGPSSPRGRRVASWVGASAVIVPLGVLASQSL